MKDPEILIEIWKTLKTKKNVIVFVDSENVAMDKDLVFNWFEKIIKQKVSEYDALMLNGTYLCIRKLLRIMPRIDRTTQDNYSIKTITSEDLEMIKECLNG